MVFVKSYTFRIKIYVLKKKKVEDSKQT